MASQPIIPPALPDNLVTREEMEAAVIQIRQEVIGNAQHLAGVINAIPAPEQRSDDGMMRLLISTFSALGYALSARALLLLSLLGAFALAAIAMQSQSAMSLWILIAYSLSTVVPVTVLEIRKTRE